MIQSYITDLLAADLLAPRALWLLVPAALVILYCAVKTRRSYLSLIFRAAVFFLIIFALADPIQKSSTSEEELLALLDTSGSIASQGRAALLSSVAPYLTSNNRKLKLVPFGRKPGSEPVVINDKSQLKDSSTLRELAAQADTGDTNIAAAINYALVKSQSSSVLLLSDGFETSGNARQAAAAAAAKGLKLFPLVPDEEPFLEQALSISSLTAPIVVNAGDIAQIRTSIKNSYEKATAGKLQLWLDDKLLNEQEIQIPAHEERLLTVNTPEVEGGLKRIRAVLKPDGAPNTIERHRWLSAKERSKILLLSGTTDDNRVLKKVLAARGHALEDIVADGSQTVPTTFAAYSTVIINNAAKRQLPSGFLSNLKGFTEGGGGVLLIGGDKSFGLGDYINTPLEEISPVKFVPPQTTKRRLNSAVILVIDKSRSMVYEGKIEGAKEAALSSINSLKDDDYVGVIGFDSTPFVIIKLDKVPEVKPIAERRLRNLTAAGKTNLLPALAAARQNLRTAEASRKHIIVLSDGKLPLAGNSYADEIGRLRDEGISVSAVALGVEADIPFMKMIANYGKGAFYHTLDASHLPDIFIQDIKVTTGEKTLNEKQDFPVELGPDGLVSTTIRSYPPLRGFVETLPKKGATLELVTRKGENPFPILSSWNFGRGHVIAYTSDANGRWSMPWLQWDGFVTFWDEVFDKVKNKGDNEAGEVDFDLRYAVSGGSVNFDLAIFDEKLGTQNAPKITADVVQPGGEPTQISFVPGKKGRFSAAIEHGRPGDYRLNFSYGNVKFPPLAITVSADSFGEVPGRGLNVQTLADLAYLTGGVINPSADQLSPGSRTTESSKHLFPPLVILAFVLLMLEAFIRELGSQLVSRLFGKKQSVGAPKKSGIYQPKRQAA